MKRLPLYFCIKRDAENPLWDKYIDWLNKKDPKRNLDGDWNVYYGNEYVALFENKKLIDKKFVIITLDQWNEIVNPEQNPNEKLSSIDKKRVREYLKLTYETIKVRSDGVKFKKDTIDGETIESIQKQIGEHRSQANKLQGLLTAHKNLKF